MSNINKNKKSLPVCTLLWQDAAYSYEKEFSEEIPLPQLTFGFIVAATDDHTNISTSVSYDQKTGEFYPADGFVVPKKVTISFKKIGVINNLDDDQ